MKKYLILGMLMMSAGAVMSDPGDDALYMRIERQFSSPGRLPLSSERTLSITPEIPDIDDEKPWKRPHDDSPLWEVLFNGSSLSSFNATGNANWTVKDRTVEADTGNGFLVTKESYEDFYMELEFYSEKNTNSGVFFRCADGNAITDQNCYEANIFDNRPDPTYRTGGVTNIQPPAFHMDTEKRWNTYAIDARGRWITVYLNGRISASFANNKLPRGPIALQFAQGGIKFRNVKITRLPPNSKAVLDREIVGVWDLAGFTLDDGKGNVRAWCEGAHGTILYTPKGYMSVAINCESDPRKMVHYSGPYRLEYRSEGNLVVHHVRNFSDSNLNQTFRRMVEISDSFKQLTLTGPFGDGGKAVITWRRR